VRTRDIHRADIIPSFSQRPCCTLSAEMHSIKQLQSFPRVQTRQRRRNESRKPGELRAKAAVYGDGCSYAALDSDKCVDRRRKGMEMIGFLQK